MTAAESSLGAEAVEAAAHAVRATASASIGRDVRETTDAIARVVLAAALPHLRAQVLAEVDAALRDAWVDCDRCDDRVIHESRWRDVLTPEETP